MHNSADQNPLHFTELLEKYNDYIIEWATHPSRSDPERWMGVFHARKDGAPTLRGSIANLQDTEQAAQDKAIEIAKTHVDQAVAGQG